MNRKRWLVLPVVLMLGARPALAIDAYNNFGAGDTYDTTTGHAVQGGDFDAPLLWTDTPRISGSRFTSEATGILAVIRIALHDQFTPGFNQVDIRLHEATPTGELGPVMAAFTRGGLPAFGGSEAPETISSFDPAVILTAGERYWIVVAPGDSTTEAVWNWNSLGTGDRFAQSINFGATYDYSDGRQGAMRIELIPVPEPASLCMLAGCLCLIASRGQQRG